MCFKYIFNVYRKFAICKRVVHILSSAFYRQRGQVPIILIKFFNRLSSVHSFDWRYVCPAHGIWRTILSCSTQISGPYQFSLILSVHQSSYWGQLGLTHRHSAWLGGIFIIPSPYGSYRGIHPGVRKSSVPTWRALYELYQNWSPTWFAFSRSLPYGS